MVFTSTKGTLCLFIEMRQNTRYKSQYAVVQIDRPGAGGGGSEGVRLTPLISSKGAGFDPLVGSGWEG